jgi:hypothetical protein
MDVRNWLYTSSRLGGWLALAIGCILAMTSPAHAEDLKNRWYFGGNISFLSTTDDIRSNSAIIIGDPGDDGIPFTGDPNEDQGCLDSSIGGSGPFCDPRPDDLLSRETSIEETFKLELNAGYGLTSWLSLQFDASYFKGDVGPIDAFVRQPFLGTNIPDTPPAFVGLDERVISVQAGKITEIPVALSGVIRFRKDSPLNPYLMVGAGMIFAEMDVSSDVAELNARLGQDRIKGVFNETNGDILPTEFAAVKIDGRVPFQWPVTVNVDDAFEWHLGAGAEYFFNDKLSFVFDARYMFADQGVEISLAGEDQVNFLIFSENLFRPDGSVRFFVNTGSAPNTLCTDAEVTDPNGVVTRGSNCAANDPPDKRVTCGVPAVGDFDNSGAVPGDPDICYNNNLYASPTAGSNRPEGLVVVQGGKIDLSGLSVAVGMRFHW